MPGMMGQPQGNVVVQQQPTLRGQMPAPAPQAQAGGSATTAGVQQAAQQQPAMGGMPQQQPQVPPQLPGAPLMPPPVQMPGQKPGGMGMSQPGTDVGAHPLMKVNSVLSLGATAAPTPPAPPAPPPPQGWVGPPISPDGQGPVTSQVPPIDEQPPMFPQNPMQKANMASAMHTLKSSGFMKKSFGGMLGLFGLAGGAYGAGAAGKGRRTRGAISGAVRGAGTGLGATLGAVGGLGLGAKFLESGILRNHPNAEALAASGIGMGATGLGGLLGYKATGFMPHLMGLEDDEEQQALDGYKYSSFGVHTLDGPMVGTPEPPNQPPVVTTERESKKVNLAELFKEAGFFKRAMPGISPGAIFKQVGGMFGRAANTGAMDDVARVSNRFMQQGGKTLNRADALARMNRVKDYAAKRMARGAGGASPPGTGLVPYSPPAGGMPPPMPYTGGAGAASQAASTAAPAAAPGMFGKAWNSVQNMYNKIPQGVRNPIGGYVTGSTMGTGADAIAEQLGYDTNFADYGGMLGAGLRMPQVTRAFGKGTALGKARQFFTEGAKGLSPTAGKVQRGLFHASYGVPIAGAVGGMVADNYVNNKINDIATRAGFTNGQEGLDFMNNVNSGNLAPVISHMWGRLSPEQKMGIIGGGGLLAAGALGGATGLTGGMGTAGLMGAGALGLGMGTGLLQMPPQLSNFLGHGGGAPAQQGPTQVAQAQQQMPQTSQYSPRNEYAMQAHLA